MACDLMHMGGFATLAMDFRHFGGSDGEPRNLIDPVKGAEDMVTAMRWVRENMADRFDLSNLALLGCSMGGALGAAAALQIEQQGIPLKLFVSYVGALITNRDPNSTHAKTEEEQKYFEACVLLDTMNPGTIYLPTVDRDNIGVLGGPRPEFEGCCFLKNYCQVGCITPPELEASRNYPPARSFGLIPTGFN